MPTNLERIMQLVKLFTGLEGQTEVLEQEINGWVQNTGAKIVQISGNIAPQSTGQSASSDGLGGGGRPPSDLFVIVLYEV